MFLELINSYLQPTSWQTITDIADRKILFILVHICLTFTNIPRLFRGHPHVKVIQIMMGTESQKMGCHHKAMELLLLCGSEIISAHILSNKISRQSASPPIMITLKDSSAMNISINVLFNKFDITFISLMRYQQ